jgi:hypothetical protein
VPLFPDVVGEPAEPEEVARPEEAHPVLEGEPLSGEDFLGEPFQLRAAETVQPAHGIAGLVTGW